MNLELGWPILLSPLRGFESQKAPTRQLQTIFSLDEEEEVKE